MTTTLALAGDTMLGRGVAEVLSTESHPPLFSEEVREFVSEADLFVLNLECCISERGQRWPEPGKPFFFRAPPRAVEVLGDLGVDCVTLANNHALDYGYEALLDTFDHLRSAGIAWVGAGPDPAGARAPATIEARGYRLVVIGATDHPADFAAGSSRPGVALADLRGGVPDWLVDAIRSATGDGVLVTPHWGPNMMAEPLPAIRAAAAALVDAGATLVAGHSAHVFQGVNGRVLYDLGDFVDDYAVDLALRNDLGLLFLVTLEEQGPLRVEALPLKLDYCRTVRATGEDADWIRHRFTNACAAFGTSVSEDGGRLVIDYSSGSTR
jgi:poly-gamma-glutamate capsule biosynthesis protein CapA/YwtB (metallophosphatase superfamily)